jgi:hypothetical protein
MTSRLPQFTLRFRLSAALACACIAGGLLPASTARAADPEITSQPRSGAAAFGESFGFSVTANGTAPLAYQWRRGSASLTGATNATLTINNVTNANAGSYRVVVSNSLGSITSAPAILTVGAAAPRTLRNGTVRSDGQAVMPLWFSGNGRETALEFSVSFRPDAFTNPSFESLGTNSITGTNGWFVDVSRAAEGLVGLRIQRPFLEPFPPTNYLLGNLRFDYVSTNDPLSGRLAFTNTPTALRAEDTNQLSLILDAAIVPQLENVTPAPALNRQSGLFEQLVAVAHAGANVLANVDVLVAGLGNDSRTNAIRVYNSIGTRVVGPDAAGVTETLPFLSAGGLAPGETRRLTIEYYVSDHLTVPTPEYLLQVANRIVFTLPAAATPLNITTNRFVNGTFIIQFPTRTSYRYFVQYAPTLNDLVNATTNSRVANPAVSGTGFDVQWIDNGPPKTESLPVAGSRFYRVLEVRAQ